MFSYCSDELRLAIRTHPGVKHLKLRTAAVNRYQRSGYIGS